MVSISKELEAQGIAGKEPLPAGTLDPCYSSKTMKIINNNEGLVSNFEVYQLLLQVRPKQNTQQREEDEEQDKMETTTKETNNTTTNTESNGNNAYVNDKTAAPTTYKYEVTDERKKRQLKSARTLEHRAIEYLEQSPVANETEQGIVNCLSKLQPYKLTKAEKLQIINLAPTSEPVVNLIIEECEERLKTDQDMQQLIDDIKATLNVPSKPQT